MVAKWSATSAISDLSAGARSAHAGPALRGFRAYGPSRSGIAVHPNHSHGEKGFTFSKMLQGEIVVLHGQELEAKPEDLIKDESLLDALEEAFQTRPL